MGRVIDALIAYRVIKLVVTPFNKTKAFKFGIIDDKGKVLIKSKNFLKTFSSQELPKARNIKGMKISMLRFIPTRTVTELLKKKLCYLVSETHK